MTAELQFDAGLIPICQVLQPFDDAQGLALPLRLDAGLPAPADPVDALDQLKQRENVGGLQVAGQCRVQPGDDRVAGFRGLGNQAFKPAQRIELARDQSSAPAQGWVARPCPFSKAAS